MAGLRQTPPRRAKCQPSHGALGFVVFPLSYPLVGHNGPSVLRLWPPPPPIHPQRLTPLDGPVGPSGVACALVDAWDLGRMGT